NHRDTAKSYSLYLHDALPIYSNVAKQVSNSEKQTNVADFQAKHQSGLAKSAGTVEDNTLESKQQENTPVSTQTSENGQVEKANIDRKSTRLNSSHVSISYAVF